MNTLFKKKILHRAKYRGVKELDIVFERFVLKFQKDISCDELYELKEILDMPDNELLDIILKKKEIPKNFNNLIMKKIMSVCNA
jgi:succinate dehydrogenase flavin-adding protein (antitoxin of CptAB toxin-antitoxin module)